MVVHFGGQPAQMTAVGKKIDPSNSEFRIPNPELECSANDPTVHGLPSSSDPQPSTLNPQPVRVPGIMDVCRAHGVRVVEDAAHAFPARWGGRMIGSIGDITCFSFYANKTITTAEGGMLTTDDERLFKRVKVMRLHGIDRDIWNRFTAEKPSWEYDVVAPGFKYNLPDVNAAIGLAQLERAEAMRRVRQHCVEYYLDHLAGIDCLDLPVNRVPWTDHACHLFPLVVKPEAPVNRNRLIELLFERGIGTSVHYKPLHRMTYYRERYQLNPELFPNAERIWQGAVTLPLYPSLTEEDQAYVVEAVRELLDGGSQ
ncbi:MAG: DegT/DnrJ/EryC1/StrS family aminotransferase [Verrucomicrobia bacterium]|nr:DegT/DnrJ/EryC1/StrS family aminotransferase [Verrucomicrobiota bacterium]